MEKSRQWMWVDTLLAIIRIFYYGVGILYFINNPSEIGMSKAFFFLWFGLCIVIPHLFWRPGFINDVLFSITEFLLVGSFHLYFIFYLHQPIGISLLFMPSLIIGFIARKQTIIFSPIILFLLVTTNYYIEPNLVNGLNNYLVIGILFTFGYLFSHLLNAQMKAKALLEANREQTKLIQAQNKTLEQYAKKVEELSVSAERNRIAGELHDTIGHTFTSVIVGMDAVMYLIDPAPEKAKERLSVLRDVTKNGLQQLREHIHDMAMDDENLSLSDRLEKLAKEFSEYTSTEVSVEVSGDEIEVTKSISSTLIRCLQESLTNAKRHGEATKIIVKLDFHIDSIQLTIVDNGIGSGDFQFGYGLRTMQDRLSIINGELQVQSKQGAGTTITCLIPTKGVYDEQNKNTAS